MLPKILKFARKLVKSQPWCKRVGHNIFCDFFILEAIVGKLVKTPPPHWEESWYITALNYPIGILLN